MKVLIIGGNGKTGKLVVSELINKNHNVSVVVRNVNKYDLEVNKIIQKNVLELTKEDIKDFDVIVVALGQWDENKLNNLIDDHNHIIELLNNTDIHVIPVLGAGSLFENESRTKRLIENDGWDPYVLKIAKTCMKIMQNYINSNNKYTIFIPAVTYDFEGKKTNDYKVGEDYLIFNNNNESYLSYSDAAQVIRDYIDQNKFDKKFITAVSNK